MNKGVVIADSGPIFSLAIIESLEILPALFNQIRIANAVWEKITLNKTSSFYQNIYDFFKPKVASISSFNDLVFVMDYGESES